MIAEEGSINHLLNEHDTIQILLDAILHKSIIVKRNAAEGLAFLIKDEVTRNEHIKSDNILHICLSEH